MMGGLSSIVTLDKPFTITRDLNEWVRFDTPGDYAVTVVSGRVSRARYPGFNDDDTPALKSLPLKLHIIPATTEWQRATLDRIVGALAVPHEPNSPDSEARENALADLRYLASPAAIPLLAAQLRDDEDNAAWQARLGLFGLPLAARDATIHAMSDLINNPRFPVGSLFLDTFARLKMPLIASVPQTREARDARSAERQSYLEGSWREAATALSRKEGSARAITAHTLLSATFNDADPQNRA